MRATVWAPDDGSTGYKLGSGPASHSEVCVPSDPTAWNSLDGTAISSVEAVATTGASGNASPGDRSNGPRGSRGYDEGGRDSGTRSSNSDRVTIVTGCSVRIVRGASASDRGATSRIACARSEAP